MVVIQTLLYAVLSDLSPPRKLIPKFVVLISMFLNGSLEQLLLVLKNYHTQAHNNSTGLLLQQIITRIIINISLTI